MLSSFLPPVPSLPSDPPEHFPLRKTGELDRQVGTLREIRHRVFDLSQGQECRMRGGLGCAGPEQSAHCGFFSWALPSLTLTHWEGGTRGQKRKERLAWSLSHAGAPHSV
jgi:hypothetical protein